MLLVPVLVANLVLAGGPWAGEASACSCAGGSSSPEEALRESDAVFSGEVVDIGRLPPLEEGSMTVQMPDLNPVTFDVKESWKGVSGGSAVVHGQGPAPSCGLDFERGETYLVFAGRGGEGDGALQTDYCGNTFPASEETARNILGPPPTGSLPETGGPGVFPLGVMAAAGAVLALLTSAALVRRQSRVH